jgi:hypothetical protein
VAIPRPEIELRRSRIVARDRRKVIAKLSRQVSLSLIRTCPARVDPVTAHIGLAFTAKDRLKNLTAVR